MSAQAFFDRGWYGFGYDDVLANWVSATLSAARDAVQAPQNAKWLRCGDTWFVGVNALPNDADGAVCGAPAVGGRAVDFIRETLRLETLDWEPAQVSVTYPGYPRPMTSESAAAFRYRRDRDAAHLDGLLPEGDDRHRHLREYHGFLLGIPMVVADRDAAPFVVWEGSHELVREAFRGTYAGLTPQQWGDQDVTAMYQILRRRIFSDCRRRVVHAGPGEAYLVHRLALHGVAPWAETARAGSDGRMVVYFRPEVGGPEQWLLAP